MSRRWSSGARAPVLLLLAAALQQLAAQGDAGARLAQVRRFTAAGDHGAAVALIDSLVALAPNYPNFAFNRAIALGAGGRHEAAAAEVRRLLRWDARYARRVLQEPALAGAAPFVAALGIDSLAAAADRPRSRGMVWASVGETDLVLEGTAWDPATRSLLIGSLHKHKVIAISGDGRVSDRMVRGANGLNSVVGIHVDSARGLLWVASARRFDTPSDTATPALFAFDAATGAFRRRVDLPVVTAFPNDITSAPDGTVYLTDTQGVRIWVLHPGAERLEEFRQDIPWLGMNGITISADGRHLFVSDADHIRVVERASGRSWKLAVPDSVNVSNIDGLAWTEGALIAHHPLSFWRVTRYDLDPGTTRITGVDHIEWNTPDSRTSTTGEVVGGTYYYIGNGQIDRMNQRTIDPATMEPIRIYRAPIRP